MLSFSFVPMFLGFWSTHNIHINMEFISSIPQLTIIIIIIILVSNKHILFHPLSHFDLGHQAPTLPGTWISAITSFIYMYLIVALHSGISTPSESTDVATSILTIPLLNFVIIVRDSSDAIPNQNIEW